MAIKMDDYTTVIQGLDRGDTARVDHESCPAGEDHKQRLYLTRPAASANIILGYCHNCQESGFKRDNQEKYRDFRTSPTLEQPTVFNVPTNMVAETAKWPTLATVWRIEKGFSMDDCEALGIQYDPSTHRIYLPQWDIVGDDNNITDATLQGYQLRSLQDSGAKYLNASKNNESPSTVFMIKCLQPTPLDLAFVVEDLASGNALAKTLDYLAIPSKVIVNYGTKVTPMVLQRVKNFNLGVVWLDNDSSHVKGQSEKINKVWAMLSGQECRSEMFLSDPKSEDIPTRIECIQKWQQEHGPSTT